jgi:hypothetical protein
VDIAAKGLQLDLAGAVWRKSSFSGPNSDMCVEVAVLDNAIAVRDSKNPSGPTLIFTPAEWDAFVRGAKDGEFDL